MKNLKQIMSRAWEIYKNITGEIKAIFGECLKMAWAESKLTNQQYYGVKNWFINKNFNSQEAYIINLACNSKEFIILKETEKAVFIQFNSDFGSLKSWFPKSTLKTEEDVKEEEKSFLKGINRYQKALEFAKANNLKVRNKMKLATILEKINQAGLKFEY